MTDEITPAALAELERLRPWRVRLICCGHDEGSHSLDTWEQADEFRNGYISGSGVKDPSVPGSYGHERSAIIERDASATPTDAEVRELDRLLAKATPLGEPVVFARCDECPRPGHFHGKACWVFAEQALDAPRRAEWH